MCMQKSLFPTAYPTFMQWQTIRHDYKLFFVQRQTIRHDYKLILCSGKLFAGNLLRYQIPIRVDESMRL